MKRCSVTTSMRGRPWPVLLERMPVRSAESAPNPGGSPWLGDKSQWPRIYQPLMSPARHFYARNRRKGNTTQPDMQREKDASIEEKANTLCSQVLTVLNGHC